MTNCAPVLGIETKEKRAIRQILGISNVVSEEDLGRAFVEGPILRCDTVSDAIQARICAGERVFENGPGHPAIGFNVEVLGFLEDIIDRDDDHQHQ